MIDSPRRLARTFQACAAPFYGNLASIFGSKATILGALAVLAIGDAICGAAQR